MTVKHTKRTITIHGSKGANKVSRPSGSPLSKGDWTVPRGGSIREVTHHAADQVIVNYRDALRKLKKH